MDKAEPLGSLFSENPGQCELRLSNLLAKLDTFLTRLHHCTKSRSDADFLVLFAFFTSRASGAVLDNVANAVSASRPILLTRDKSSIAVRLNDHLLRGVLRLAESSKAAIPALANVCSFARLWGLLGVYQSLKRLAQSPTSLNGVFNTSRGQVVDDFMALIQAVAMGLYFLADNVNFLAGNKIIRLSQASRTKLFLWGFRSWSVFTGLALGRLILERQRSDEKVPRKGWWEQAIRSLVMFVVAVNNSLSRGPLNMTTVSFLGLFSSGILVRDIWDRSAVAVKA